MNGIETSLIEEIVRRVVETVHPEKIILFGSQVREETHPGSDMDFWSLLIQKSPATGVPPPYMGF